MDKSITPQKPRLLNQVRERLCYQHYSLSTEKVYVYWIRFSYSGQDCAVSATWRHLIGSVFDNAGNETLA